MRAAGAQATFAVAHEDAAGLYARALSVLPEEARWDRERAELEVLRGEALWRSGDLVEADDAFNAAASHARRLGRSDLLARAALGRAGPQADVWMKPAHVQSLDEALRSLPTADDPLRVRVLARLALELYYSEHVDRRHELTAEAVAMARRLGDGATLAHALSARHGALIGPENLADRLAISDELTALADELGDRRVAFDARYWRLLDVLELGDPAAADAEVEALMVLSDEIREPMYAWYAARIRAGRALSVGQYAEGERLADEARAVATRLGQRGADLFWTAHMSWPRRDQGRHGELEDAVRRLAREFEGMPAWRGHLVMLLAGLGRHGEAQALLDALAADHFTSIPSDINWLQTLAMLAEAAHVLGDQPRAETLYSLLLPYRERNILIGRTLQSTGSVEHFLGLAATTTGRIESAREHLAAAVERNERLRLRPAAVRTRVAYADLLIDQGAPREAEAILDEAIATSRDHAFTALEAQARTLRDRAAASVGAPPR